MRLQTQQFELSILLFRGSYQVFMLYDTLF